MSSKNLYRLGTDGLSNYSTFADIPAALLAQGDNTILVTPGTYTAPTNAVWNDLAIIGVGDRDEIVIAGDLTIANTSSGTITFENLSFVGSNIAVAAGAACIKKLGASSTPIHCKNVKFSNATYAIVHNGERAVATTTPQVVLNFVDASEVNQAIVANSNVTVNYSILNTAANAYFQPGTGGGHADLVVTVRASYSGGSNTGLTTETVVSAIS